MITSREAIIAACRQLASEQGLGAINMRDVAERCHVAVGSVYNYFPSKADLIAATIQNVWHDIFHMPPNASTEPSFVGQLEWIFDSVRSGVAEYPNFFLAHSMNIAGGDKGKGRQVMQTYFGHIKNGLLSALKADGRVRGDAFSESFTKESFVDFVFSTLVSMLMRQENSCTLLLEIVRRAIY